MMELKFNFQDRCRKNKHRIILTKSTHYDDLLDSFPDTLTKLMLVHGCVTYIAWYNVNYLHWFHTISIETYGKTNSSTVRSLLYPLIRSQDYSVANVSADQISKTD